MGSRREELEKKATLIVDEYEIYNFCNNHEIIKRSDFGSCELLLFKDPPAVVFRAFDAQGYDWMLKFNNFNDAKEYYRLELARLRRL